MRRALRDRRPRRLLAVAAIGLTALAVAVLTVVPALSSAHPSKEINEKKFNLFPNTVDLPCAQAEGQKAKVKATVERGNLNDQLTLKLSGFQPGLDFDLFTVQNSNQNADGSPVEGFTTFGLAWYQSDIHIHSDGTGKVTINTILLDQIFGFDPAVALDPTNTFHVGFWFNDPKDAADCGFEGTTPFNGEHNAGPLAFITRPDASFNLGPLCTKPKSVGVCKL